MKGRTLMAVVFSICSAVVTTQSNANPLTGKMYDYESIGASFSVQLDKILAFESRFGALKSNKIAFLSPQQIDKLNRVLTRLNHIRKIHNDINKDNFYTMGRDIVDGSRANSQCEILNVTLSTTEAVQVSCKGYGYDVVGSDLFAEYQYSDFFLTTKQTNGKVVVNSYVDGRLAYVEEQIMVIDDELSRVYAPMLQNKARKFSTPGTK